MTLTNAKNRETAKAEARANANRYRSYKDTVDEYEQGYLDGRTLTIKAVDTLAGTLYGEDVKEEFLVDVAEGLIEAGLMIEPTSQDRIHAILDENEDLDDAGRAQIISDLRRIGIITG